VWLRWRRATPAERRDLAPLWVAVCIYVLVGLMGAFASPDTTGQPFTYLVWELQSVLQIGLPIVFVWGLLSTRLARSAVGDLVLELDRPLLPGAPRASLARALGDPSLEVLYAREGLDGWVDAEGQPGSLPEAASGRRARTVMVVERDGQPLAALIHDPALDPGLVGAAAAAAAMAIENERLQAEVRAQLEEVRASRQRRVEAGDAERRVVERTLHDGAQQRMATLALELAMLRDRAASDPALSQRVAGAAHRSALCHRATSRSWLVAATAWPSEARRRSPATGIFRASHRARAVFQAISRAWLRFQLAIKLITDRRCWSAARMAPDSKDSRADCSAASST